MNPNRTRVAAAMIAAATAIALSCGKRDALPIAPGEPAAAHSDEPEHQGIPKRIHLTKEVIAAAKLKWAPARKEILAATLTLAGEVVADPDKSARIASPVAGRLEEVKIKEGASVKKGDVLAIVRVPELGKVHAALAGTLSRARAARADADRLRGLYEKGIRAEQEYFDAKAKAEALEADARGLSTQLSSMGAAGSSSAPFLLPLRAPLDGVVLSRTAVVGQPITTEETLASIADLSEVWFVARIFEKDLSRLTVGSAAEVQLNAHPSDRFVGTIEAIGRQIDPIARTVTARIRLVNRGETLRIGLFGNARVVIASDTAKAPVLVVPRGAVTEVSGKPVVFVRHADDDFEVHEVVLGQTGVGKVEIASGLREGEDVVIDGAFNVKSVLLKSTLTEED